MREGGAGPTGRKFRRPAILLFAELPVVLDTASLRKIIAELNAELAT